MKAEEIEQLIEIFGGNDVLHEGDISDYFDVIRSAFDVHIDRERIRNGLWKDYPAEDQFNQVKIKVDRIVRSLEVLKKLPDTEGYFERRDDLRANIVAEAFDIINYAVFGVRIMRGLVP